MLNAEEIIKAPRPTEGQNRRRHSKSSSQRRAREKGETQKREMNIVERSSDSRQAASRRVWIAVITAMVLIVVGGGVAGAVVFTSSGTEEQTGDRTDSTSQTIVSGSTGNTAGPGPGSGTGTSPSKASSFNKTYWNTIRGDCGVPQIKPELVSSRIVGGTEAKKNSWPWQISLVKYKDYGGGYIGVGHTCGGTIVAPRFVITAAHCFLNALRTKITTNPKDLRVLVGGHTKSKLSDVTVAKISRIFHHPKNNLATFSRTKKIPVYDLTVLKLAITINPADPKPIAAFACLPTPGVLPAVQKRCWATGWGKTLDTGFDTVLKQTPQVITSEKACNKYFGRLSYEIHLCGLMASMGTCQGDSGGPLVCQGDDGKWTLYGATSFGPTPCAIAPGVYASLAHFLSWVCCHLENYGPCAKLLDELPMIYGTCVFLYSLHHHDKPRKTRNLFYLVALCFSSVAVTVIYLLWKNPVFHQVCYATLVAALVYEAIVACRNYPTIKPVVWMSVCFYAFGFFLWNVDNMYCSHLRKFRNKSYFDTGMVTQLHAWWHIFTGFATYLHVLFSCHARLLHLRKQCKIQKLGGIWPYLEIGKTD